MNAKQHKVPESRIKYIQNSHENLIFSPLFSMARSA